MLWQRFGRGARDKTVQATALLFVESKDLDPMDVLEGRKRKASEKDNEAQPKSKRAKKEKLLPMVMDADVNAAGEEEFWKARKAVYHEPISDEKKVEINQVLDDVINAEVRGVRCRRKPFRVYFNDDKPSGLYASLPCSVLDNVPQEFPTVTTLLTGPASVVRHGNLVFVVISAIQRSLKVCFRV